jgi:hypothetical protein
MEATMALARDTLTALNRDLARIPIPEDRIEPVRIEVQQFWTTIESLRSRLDFDAEPSDFHATLAMIAKANPHD